MTQLFRFELLWEYFYEINKSNSQNNHEQGSQLRENLLRDNEKRKRNLVKGWKGEKLTCGEYERDVKFRNYAKWKISKEEKKTKGRQNDTGGN